MMKIYIKHIVVFLVSLLVLLLSLLRIFFYYEQKSRDQFRVAVEFKLSPDAAQYYSEIEMIKNYFNNQKFKTKSEKFDFTRNWVHVNSIHEIDSTYSLKDAFDTPRVLSMLWRTYKKGENPVRLTCGPRAMAMKYILDKLNEKSRIVMIFSDVSEQVESHTFLEVFNTETGKYEIHDPDYNVFYIDKKFNRIDISKLIFDCSDGICPISNWKEGWKENEMLHVKNGYLKAVMLGNPITTKNPIIIINKDRFSTDKKFTKNGNISFYDFTKKYYKYPFILTLNSKNIDLITRKLTIAFVGNMKL